MARTSVRDAAKRKRALVTNSKRPATQDEIDEHVVAQAETDAAWEAPVRVSRKQSAIGLPASLAQRAAFLARLRRELASKSGT